MNAASYRIIVVEDNLLMQEALGELLGAAGHVVQVADCGEALGDLSSQSFDIALLDLNLPGEDGLSISRRLRASFPRLGIIMLTARNQPDDTLNGYLQGADNYFTKPFHPTALLAAIDNLGARVRTAALPTGGELLLDTESQTLCRGERQHVLSDNEVRLLQILLLAPEQTAESWQLLKALAANGDSDDDSDTLNKHALEVAISRLRKKLDACAQREGSIKAVRGVGYRLMLPLQVL